MSTFIYGFVWGWGCCTLFFTFAAIMGWFGGKQE